jgi:hypothetical protein
MKKRSERDKKIFALCRACPPEVEKKCVTWCKKAIKIFRRFEVKNDR